MSPLRRFKHLEGQRPAREESSQLGGNGRFASMERAAALACALCGAALADETEACAACAPSAPPRAVGGDGVLVRGEAPFAADAEPARESARSARFSTLAGNGPIGLAREVPARTAETEIAATVPAWRGEALPEDVAADVRRQLGIPEQQPAPQREDVLGWAQRQLESESNRKWLLYLGGAFFARRLIANVVGFLLAVVIGVVFLVARACS